MAAEFVSKICVFLTGGQRTMSKNMYQFNDEPSLKIHTKRTVLQSLKTPGHSFMWQYKVLDIFGQIFMRIKEE
jgi:hypothetical protein